MGCCLWFACVMLLGVEAVGEVMLFKHSNCNEWMLMLAAVINYTSAYLAFILNHENELVVDDELNEPLTTNEGQTSGSDSENEVGEL